MKKFSPSCQRSYIGICLLLLLLLSASCSKDAADMPDVETLAHKLIPIPFFIELEEDVFELTAETTIYTTNLSSALSSSVDQFVAQMRRSTGFGLEVRTTDVLPTSGYISLELLRSPSSFLGEQGYEIRITKRAVTIEAATEVGLFYSLQTLRQLMPAAVEAATVQQQLWNIPTLVIRDVPRFTYRAAMLDVARHFFSVDEVKRYIDLMSLYKLTHLHLHLTDDQGWRIEIKSWPKLTSIGASTEVGGGPGGFYTQEDYREIIDYAQARYITIVPEIDMPGHTNAALASYAELNCDGIAKELYTGTDVGFSALCLDKEITYDFVEDVIREVAALTPGPYFHIGGDEAETVLPFKYVEFINRVKEMVKSQGKQMIGWDEVAVANVGSEEIVQYWLRESNAQKALDKSAKLIFSPMEKTYLNLRYNSTITLGASFNLLLNTQRAYEWDPLDLLDGVLEGNILGIEAPLWTENVSDIKEAEYMAIPRLLGIAEIAWSRERDRNWEAYKRRLAAQKERFEFLNINYHLSTLVPW